MMRHVRVRINGQWYTVEVGDVYQSPVEVEVDGDLYLVELEEGTAGAERPQALRARKERKAEQPGLRGIVQQDDNLVRCPLPGKVISVTATKGQEMEPGDEICVLESMKMEQSVRMAQRGMVKSIKVKKNQSINAGTPLLELQ